MNLFTMVFFNSIEIELAYTILILSVRIIAMHMSRAFNSSLFNVLIVFVPSIGALGFSLYFPIKKY